MKIRTQIYLTRTEKEGLEDLSRRTGRSQADLIRQAIDTMLDAPDVALRRELLRGALGIWAERRDLPDFGALRRELDRTGDA